ncbi:cyclophilin-like fold protein [Streptomyces caniscabiei]|nr:cyclophilin-like fold protein [Streptomyces caniscabiei]MDX3511672.1 cyclophilin-like fold protein [Streptomyces caniscabiei]MDX3719221.1 cyclophilin-like fold protein [Streptomyces caniscabiei]WEO30297.1 cyclophilin-like fold protein [Streptomyces caniscabiei]
MPLPARALVRAVPAAALLLAVTACTDQEPSSSSPSRAASVPSTRGTASGPSPTTTSGRTTAMDIELTIDGNAVAGTLNGSAAARDFAALLPLTLNLSDFHETERIADLPRRLSTSGAPDGAEAKAGDLAYYAPWGNLALFYRDFPYSDGLVILGHVTDDGTDRLATAEEVTVRAAS